jgi:hypothetical protein
MGAKKVRDVAVLKTELQREHVHTSLSRQRLRKRKFGANDLEPSNSPVLPGLETDEARVAEAEDNNTDDALCCCILGST